MFHSVYSILVYIYSLEPPDVTGSSLTLGTAGSRRTVYLIDDKLPDQSSSAAEKKTSTRTASPSTIASVASNADNNITSTPTKASTSADAPSTFLMFNRISNVIGANVSGNNSTGSTSPSNNGAATNANDKNSKEKKKTTEDGKETAIWYEYGCV